MHAIQSATAASTWIAHAGEPDKDGAKNICSTVSTSARLIEPANYFVSKYGERLNLSIQWFREKTSSPDYRMYAWS